MSITRILAGAAAAVLITGAAQAQEMTIVSWGGAYTKSQQNAYHDPYMMKNPGVKIINDESSAEAAAKLRAMAEAGNTTWDLVDVDAADAIRLCDEGLAMEIDPNKHLAPSPDGMSAVDDFGDMLVSECFIPQIVYSTAFGYRTDIAAWNGREPKDVCALFDTKKFPGKRSLEKRAINNVEWALLCDGVKPADIYKVLGTKKGVERALAKLGTIKDDIIWWSAAAETPQRLADGEIVIGSTYNGRLFAAIEEQKLPVKMLWDWQVFSLDGWVIPANLSAERKKHVLDYIYFATDTQRLADQAKWISYGPARKSSALLVGKHADLGIDMAPHMPTDPKNAKTVIVYNYEFWADNRDDIDAVWQVWLAR